MAQEPLLPKTQQGATVHDARDPRASVKQVPRGIFTTVYDSPKAKPLVSSLPSKEDLNVQWANARSLWRFIQENVSIAPGTFILYTLFSMWLAVTPAISIHLCHTVLDVIQETLSTGDQPEYNATRLRDLVLPWVMVEMSFTIVKHFLDTSALALSGHIKKALLPRLARANLDLDVRYPQETRQTILHGGWSSFQNIKGLDMIQSLFNRAREIFAVFTQLYVLFVVILQSDSTDLHVLVYITSAYFILAVLKNVIGVQGFLFFTDDLHFNRQLSLHTMIYNTHPNYRPMIAKDGAAKYIAQEYERASDNLGFVPEPWHVATSPHSVALYWVRSIQTFILEHPLSLLALMLPNVSASSLATMALFLYSATRMRRGFDAIEAARNSGSFKQILEDVGRLYEVLDNIASTGFTQGYKKYPVEKSSPDGMKISFRNVSLHYETQKTPSLANITVDIKPGQLVLVVGDHGSGKSSLLNLLSRVVLPSFGNVDIDGTPIGDYDVGSLRQAMTFYSQTDTVYPMSIRENLYMALPYAPAMGINLDEAAKAGGCLELLQKHGNTIVDPPDIVSQSFNQGTVGTASHEYVIRHFQQRNVISLSEVQKQQVVAGRMLYRARNINSALLIVDRPALSLDASAERKLHSEFLKVRKNKTTIIVAQHLHFIAKQADMILCMANGRIIQQGRHDELIQDDAGTYAKLFNA
ncbi:hypothetical protein DXG03_008574 [Asterophora parasitica]|uniref:ABC transporter domain-containing protein n=1 Tax=Asterophora parasitica TaxID=117018 RepID=A0A9P7GBX9_9AGAR|nr:hypothetical protein DXG03_008574 [Asterophora parasitica]